MLRLKNIKNRHRLTHLNMRLKYISVENMVEIYQKSKTKSKCVIDGNLVHISQPKLELFKLNFTKNGGVCKCELCGVEASYAVVEKHPSHSRYHFQMYTVCKDTKNEILFNIDHIIPKSVGGGDDIDNYQLTCDVCNRTKADNYHTKYDIMFDFSLKSFPQKLSNLLTLLGSKSSAFFNIKGFKRFSVIKHDV